MSQEKHNESGKQSAALENLPPEIQYDICSNLPSAQSFRNLSLCSRRLHHYVEARGWVNFCRSEFPSLSHDILNSGVDGEDVARSLVTLSRSWDRRAVLASRLQPHSNDPHFGRDEHLETARRPWAQWRPRFRFRQRGQQTTGFQPVIASQEEIIGTDWTRRREYVVWGAGAQLGIRWKQTGIRDEDRSSHEKLDTIDQHGNLIKWNTYQPDDTHDGADDVTALKLLSRDYVSRYSMTPETKVFTIMGNAAGRLTMSKLEFKPGQEALSKKTFVYRTGRISSVRSLDISPSEDILASGYSNGLVMLHLVYNRDRKGFPISSISLNPAFGHLWATSYISDSSLAVGTGRSYQPLHVYDLGAAGLSASPIRSWKFIDNGASSGVYGSVGCIQRLPDSTGSASNVLFLTGHTDGNIRLHDMRSPEPHQAIFTDPVDDGSIFALVTKGRERLVAGNARNSLLKMWDLRVTGGRVYSYRNAAATSNTSSAAYQDDSEEFCSGVGETKNGWSMFLHPGESPALSRSSNHRWHQSHGHHHHQQQQQQNQQHQHQQQQHPQGRRSSLTSAISDARASASPIYSLSTPSTYSPSIFAGLEAQVMQLDFVDTYDKFPDAVFDAPPVRSRGQKWFWDPNSVSRTLAYYEHHRPNRLRRQVEDWPTDVAGLVDRGIDYRWSEIGDL